MLNVAEIWGSKIMQNTFSDLTIFKKSHKRLYTSSRVFSSTTLRTNPLSHTTFTPQTEVIHKAPCKAEVTNGVTNEVTISAQPKLKIFQNLPLHPVQCFLHL